MTAVVYELALRPPVGATGPRMAEVFVETSPDLRLDSGEASGLARAAGKDVTVQPRGDTVTRVVVLSTVNTDPIPSGPVATLRFRRLNPGPGAVAIRYGDSAFAPGGIPVTPETLTLEARP
jgi:hypothetical protein